MGQYFLVVNLDKEQYLHPHCFNEGLKLLEFGCSSQGTLTALTHLLRRSSEGGGGDWHGCHEIVGTWAGDRIVIVRDYDKSKLYEKAEKEFVNVSHYAIDAMMEDVYLKADIKKDRGESSMYCPCTPKPKDGVFYKTGVGYALMGARELERR